MRFLANASGCIAGTLSLLVYLGGLVLHVYTIIIAFGEAGLFAACLTLAFPVVAQVYWVVRLSSSLGIANTYNLMVLAYLIVFAAMVIFALLMQKASDAADSAESK